jgi:hypothetical protein
MPNHLRLLLVSASLLLGPPRVLAQDLPQGTIVSGLGGWAVFEGDRLDRVVAQSLAMWKGRALSLNGLHALDVDTAKILAEFRGVMLELNGLTALDAATAQALAEFKGEQLILNGLTRLDVDAAKGLASFSGTLHIGSLAVLDAEVAEALAGAEKFNAALPRVTALDAETARVLAGFKAQKLSLAGLPTCDPAVAGWLGKFGGMHLALDGVTTLDAETARSLANFQGECLSLRALTTLDADTAEVLEDFKGVLEMPLVFAGLGAKTPLTLSLARMAGKSPSFTGLLPGVTALESPDSVAIAQALAARNGPLALPNLKKISPRTLSALIEKEDVKIPLIETLELIPEPDGSPNDDFVIPEGLEDRQKGRQRSR